MSTTKVLRSFIHEKFPLDLRVQLDILSRRRDIQNKPKHEKLIELLREYGVENIVQLGPGTNRYAIKLDGFVVKFATDNDGKIDNFKEFKMAKLLYPYVAKTYEVSDNGTILVAEYIPPFDAYSEMLQYAERIRAILTKLSAVYLIGDVGISSKNFKNWGIRVGTDDPVCLDFAYVYDVSSELFLCRSCKNNSMLVPNRDFTDLYCPAPGCGKRYTFEDIRGRLSDAAHMKEIGDLSQEGYRLYESNVLTTLDENRSNYLALKKPKVKEADPIEEERITKYDSFSLDHQPSYYLKGGNNDMNYNNKPRELARDMAAAAKVNVILTNGSAPTQRVITAKAYVVSQAPAVATTVIANGTQPAETPKNPVVIPSNDTAAATATHTKGPSVYFHVASVVEEVEHSHEEPGEVGEIEDFDTTDNEQSVTEPESEMKAEEMPDAETFDGSEANGGDIQEGGSESAEEQLTTENQDAGEAADELTSGIDPKFYSTITRAISKFGNTIRSDLYIGEDLYNDIREDLKGPQLLAEKFYGIVQNAVYRSLIDFLGMVQVDVPNANGNGTHVDWVPPAKFDAKVEPTVIYLQRLWNSRDLMNIQSSIDRNYEYCSRYEDFRGIQPEWLDVLKSRLKRKLGNNLDDYNIQIIVDTINEIAVDIVREVNADPDTDSDDGDDVGLRFVQASTETSNYAVEGEQATDNADSGETLSPEEIAERAFIDAFGKDEQKIRMSSYYGGLTTSEHDQHGGCHCGDSCTCHHGDADEAEDEDEGCVSVLSVEVFEEGTVDIIKVISDDAFGDIAIPIYVDLSSIDPAVVPPSQIDDRNGYWDWLIHVVPDGVFRTADPDKWMSINSLELDEEYAQVRTAILDHGDDGLYTMGIYYVEGVYVVDEEYDRHFNGSPDLLRKINQVISREIGHTAMSHLRMSIANDALMYDEASFEEILAPLIEAHRVLDEQEEQAEVIEKKRLEAYSYINGGLNTSHLENYTPMNNQSTPAPTAPKPVGNNGIYKVVRRND